ncbi:hypothetical protein ACQEVI_03560 [Promicromonospora sp. CA-289599]|uniref:hypothetical protein n=1 Tax=Promicromonospora sp. CA-289599 TaxID=3240014 RepID=UPI003D8E55F3
MRDGRDGPAQSRHRTWPGRRAVEQLHGQWVRHPRWALAAKGASAAAIAWVIGLFAPAPFSEYPYYAPLGAVVAMSSTAVSSVRVSAQAVGAVLMGAAIARGVDAVLASSVLSVALVVAVALLCAGWRVFGTMGNWVATSGLFVLILGGVEYVGVFSGLVVVGATVAVTINILLPPLPLTPSRLALDRLRDVLVDQVDVLAERLQKEGPLDAEEWEDRRRQVTSTIDHARQVASSTREATRINRKARRYGKWATAQVQRAQALAAAAEVVNDLVRILAEWERRDRENMALGPGLRPELATALRAYANALRPDPDDHAFAEATERCEGSVDELGDAVRADARSSGHDHFVAGAVVVALWRGTAALTQRPYVMWRPS